MWEVDSLDNINKEQSWSNDMLRSMKAWMLKSMKGWMLKSIKTWLALI